MGLFDKFKKKKKNIEENQLEKEVEEKKEFLEEKKEFLEEKEFIEEEEFLQEEKELFVEEKFLEEDEIIKRKNFEEKSIFKDSELDDVRIVKSEYAEEIEEDNDEDKNIFGKLKQGLTKTKSNFNDKVSDMMKRVVEIDDDLYEELEEILITADVGMDTSIEIVKKLSNKVEEDKIKDIDQVIPTMKKIMIDMLEENKEESDFNINEKLILLIVGVNGAGKTTSIGKLANNFKQNGKKVLMVAADTFRAGAIEQLNVWSQRSGVDIVKQQEGGDPAAVVFDGLSAMKSRKMDILLCDTAGRLQNKKNLMNELEKIKRIIDKEGEGAIKKTYLVLDGTTGQNAVVQAKEFKAIASLDGIILTKLDGTAKGGVAFAIANELKVPIKYIGVGEGIYDLQEFDAELFVDAVVGDTLKYNNNN